MDSVKKYWDRRPALKTGADYIISYGKRSAGKSYQALDYVLEQYIDHGGTALYVRRRDNQIEPKALREYLGQDFVRKLVSMRTKGEWETLSPYHGEIVFSKYDSNGKMKYGKPLLHPVALSRAGKVKSVGFENSETLIFEEFIADTVSGETYLEDEVTALETVISTFFRGRKCIAFLLGNSLECDSPYMYEWGLDGMITQKPGTIDTYRKETCDESGTSSVVTIAVEHTDSTLGGSPMVFRDKGAINRSGWSVKDCPKLPGTLDDYTEIYIAFFAYKLWTFLGRVLLDNKTGNAFWYVVKWEDVDYENHRIIPRDISEDDRLISDRVSMSPMWTLGLKPISPRENPAIELLRAGKIYYDNNTTGTHFQTTCQNLGIILPTF